MVWFGCVEWFVFVGFVVVVFVFGVDVGIVGYYLLVVV